MFEIVVQAVVILIAIDLGLRINYVLTKFITKFF